MSEQVPVEVLQAQLSTLDLLESMFPLEGELVLKEETLSKRESLVALSEGNTSPTASQLSIRALQVVLRVLLEDNEKWAIEMDVSLPLSSSDSSVIPKPVLTLAHPSYLSRSAYLDLQKGFSDFGKDLEGPEYVLEAVEWLKINGRNHLLKEQDQTNGESSEVKEIILERVWFWFPSLSTREKRRDLVTYATRYRLTGFVLAGKPGLLCLEGEGEDVDEYMSAIKSESWSDIPSYQKKVTERHRQPITERAFTDMQEITDQITQRGQHGNRGEMSEVKQFMDSNGVGDAFAIVVGGGF